MAFKSLSPICMEIKWSRLFDVPGSRGGTGKIPGTTGYGCRRHAPERAKNQHTKLFGDAHRTVSLSYSTFKS